MHIYTHIHTHATKTHCVCWATAHWHGHLRELSIRRLRVHSLRSFSCDYWSFTAEWRPWCLLIHLNGPCACSESPKDRNIILFVNNMLLIHMHALGFALHLHKVFKPLAVCCAETHKLTGYIASAPVHYTWTSGNGGRQPAPEEPSHFPLSFHPHSGCLGRRAPCPVYPPTPQGNIDIGLINQQYDNLAFSKYI